VVLPRPTRMKKTYTEKDIRYDSQPNIEFAIRNQKDR